MKLHKILCCAGDLVEKGQALALIGPSTESTPDFVLGPEHLAAYSNANVKASASISVRRVYGPLLPALVLVALIFVCWSLSVCHRWIRTKLVVDLYEHTFVCESPLAFPRNHRPIFTTISSKEDVAAYQKGKRSPVRLLPSTRKGRFQSNLQQWVPCVPGPVREHCSLSVCTPRFHGHSADGRMQAPLSAYTQERSLHSIPFLACEQCIAFIACMHVYSYRFHATNFLSYRSSAMGWGIPSKNGARVIANVFDIQSDPHLIIDC